MEGQVHQAWLSALFGGACLWGLWRGRRAVAGTTLRAAWCWAMLSVAAIVLVELPLGLSDSIATSHHEPVRFAAAALTLAHTIAVFGAKRPQNSAWQFVVLSLWGVLAWPALEVWLRGKGEPLDIHALSSWFLLILIVAGTANHLPTRFALPAVCVAAAQVVLLWPQLPFSAVYDRRPAPSFGLILLLVSLLFAHRSATMRPRAKPSGAHDNAALARWSFVWRDFRDWFGVVWSARVMERMNASAATYHWPVALSWEGFVTKNLETSPASHNCGSDGPSASHIPAFTPQQHDAIESAMRALLRRFVSATWIERRLTLSRVSD